MKLKRKKNCVVLLLLILAGALCCLLYRYNVIPHRSYDAAYFGIQTYRSDTDADGDGLDDQMDILESARRYIATRPSYKSKYYETGYPNDGYGVCTDVVDKALLDSGYDLMNLVQEDIAAHPEDYEIEEADPRIDFRRVRNLNVYFGHTADSLTTDISDIAAWQGGDIIVFEKHIGIVSDKRNKKGIPFVIHHANPFQVSLEEDILELPEYGKIVAHYRIRESKSAKKVGFPGKVCYNLPYRFTMEDLKKGEVGYAFYILSGLRDKACGKGNRG